MQYITENSVLNEFFETLQINNALILDTHFTRQVDLNNINPLPSYLAPSSFHIAGIIHISVTDETARKRMLERKREKVRTQDLSEKRILQYNRCTLPRITIFRSTHANKFIEIDNNQDGAIPVKVSAILDQITRLPDAQKIQLNITDKGTSLHDKSL